MKNLANWKAWEAGNKKRVYVGESKYLEKGATGLINAVGLDVAEIETVYKWADGKNFDELYEMVKASNATGKTNKKTVAQLKKEQKAALENAKNDAEKEAIFIQYAKLIKEAKYA